MSVGQGIQGDRGPHDERQASPANPSTTGTATYMRWWPRVELKRVLVPDLAGEGCGDLGPVAVVVHDGGLLLGIAHHPAVGQDDGQADAAARPQFAAQGLDWRLRHRRPPGAAKRGPATRARVLQFVLRCAPGRSCRMDRPAKPVTSTRLITRMISSGGKEGPEQGAASHAHSPIL